MRDPRSRHPLSRRKPNAWTGASARIGVAIAPIEVAVPAGAVAAAVDSRILSMPPPTLPVRRVSLKRRPRSSPVSHATGPVPAVETGPGVGSAGRNRFFRSPRRVSRKIHPLQHSAAG